MGAMFRDEREAMARKIDVMDREAETLRADNAAMREQLLAQHGVSASTFTLDPYRADVSMLDPGLRAALRHHQLQPFPVWLIGVLNVLTFGFFPLIWLNLSHDRLPRAHSADPTTGRAIGFAFIPYFNLYWVFFSSLRLCDRLNLQMRLRGLPEQVPRGLVMATAIFTVIPYLNILIGFPILWTITVCFYQRTINRLVAAGQ